MAPPRKRIDWKAVIATAKEVAETEAIPSRSKVASRLGLVESTLNKAMQRDGMLERVEAILYGAPEQDDEPPVPDGIQSAANDPTPVPWKAEDVIRAHGDDPDECVILRQRGNRWGDPAEPRHQLRVDWVRKDDVIQPPDPGD